MTHSARCRHCQFCTTAGLSLQIIGTCSSVSLPFAGTDYLFYPCCSNIKWRRNHDNEYTDTPGVQQQSAGGYCDYGPSNEYRQDACHELFNEHSGNHFIDEHTRKHLESVLLCPADYEKSQVHDPSDLVTNYGFTGITGILWLLIISPTKKIQTAIPTF